MWPDILAKYPDAELHIAYGWNLFDTANHNNPERMKWKQSVEMMMNQKGIFHYGRVGQDKLAEIRKQCGIWAYPTYFTEINCITGLEAQRDGLVPCVANLAALEETVYSGVKVEGDIRNPQVQQQYLDELLSLMGDTKRFEKESKKAKSGARKYSWPVIASKWVEVFQEERPQPLVSVITPTIRGGFFNLMADNLSKQTYKNFEWIIVDDYKEDRSEIAQKYAQKYNLNIKYIRGDKARGQYSGTFGLVRANNKAWKKAEGELLVWLQDFVLIPERGIEDLVTLYNHNPNSLLAPTDTYYHCINPDLTNTEDWFNGKVDVLTGPSWANIRTKNLGIRKTDNAFDFELNYAGIPRTLLETLNGFWEFYDNGLGYDNTDLAYRTLQLGFDIIIDDTNVATCLDLIPHIGGTKENVTEKERSFGLVYFTWMIEQMKKGNLPIIRDSDLDKTITHKVEVPEGVTDVARWIDENALHIATEWGDL